MPPQPVDLVALAKDVLGSTIPLADTRDVASGGFAVVLTFPRAVTKHAGKS
ncbi:hypothetical protein [Burkholderia ubonensis]|uniref:hypothetical protein n=1 Tax=Burkholderia ubonensis TaxID=101571 RepID=UPI0015C6F366|nr:hypothetical protein [Burkholderia ubonensis]